ncbi:MAG: alpha/beta hydrolase [Lyngbya sp. HA4199-MV5]|jgi:acetyl esterase/lipase|nr:alpha/beta hydrolase [Lyngbya sp. HA4199-MV5]
MPEYRRYTPAEGLRQNRPHLHRRAAVWKWVRWLLVGLVLLGLAAYASIQLSPYPKALLIRYGFDKGAVEISQKLEKHVPPGVNAILNEPYRANDQDALLDVFYPQTLQSSDQVLPTIVWVHGGAWISGNKSHVANYLKILASHGYTAVGVGYSIAPGHQYPTPLFQINDALQYLQQQAKRLHIDTNRFVLAGDSAGAQMASQMAAIVTNPAYAKTIGIRPALQPGQLKATLLNCGAYDPKSVNYNGSFGSFLKTVMWSYSGTKAFLTDPAFQSFAVINYVTKNFPPSFITTGNADPLAPQSVALAKKLTQAGVRTDTLFYPNDHTPPLEHEYQFNLDLADGQQALKRILAFLGTALK